MDGRAADDEPLGNWLSDTFTGKRDMSSLIHPTPVAAPPPLPVATPPRYGGGVLLSGIRWETYQSLLRDLGERPGVRLTYDRGRLEIMSPLPEHENYHIVLAQFVRVLAAESGMRYRSFGSTTFRREDVERVLEPDDCFYLASLPRILGRRDLDLARDPPPDLALEVDITHSSLDRLAIYAALGVREVWRFDGQSITCHVLNAQGDYEQQESSLAFPFLRVAELVPFLLQVFDTDEATLVQAFQNWLRTQVLKRPAPGQP
jgi:Uma2 family endonuclease